MVYELLQSSPASTSAASEAVSEAVQWSPPEKLSKLSAKVRFEDKPYKCHHLLSNEAENEPRWPQQAVQRTQSNPEMELCPVCLARKECEILLKRTYSKVKQSFFCRLNFGALFSS